MLAFAATMCMGSCSRAWSCFLHISQRCGLLPADAPKAVIRRKPRPHLGRVLAPLEVI